MNTGGEPEIPIEYYPIITKTLQPYVDDDIPELFTKTYLDTIAKTHCIILAGSLFNPIITLSVADNIVIYTATKPTQAYHAGYHHVLSEDLVNAAVKIVSLPVKEPPLCIGTLKKNMQEWRVIKTFIHYDNIRNPSSYYYDDMVSCIGNMVNVYARAKTNAYVFNINGTPAVYNTIPETCARYDRIVSYVETWDLPRSLSLYIITHEAKCYLEILLSLHTVTQEEGYIRPHYASLSGIYQYLTQIRRLQALAPNSLLEVCLGNQYWKLLLGTIPKCDTVHLKAVMKALIHTGKIIEVPKQVILKLYRWRHKSTTDALVSIFKAHQAVPQQVHDLRVRVFKSSPLIPRTILVPSVSPPPPPQNV